MNYINRGLQETIYLRMKINKRILKAKMIIMMYSKKIIEDNITLLVCIKILLLMKVKNLSQVTSS